MWKRKMHTGGGGGKSLGDISSEEEEGELTSDHVLPPSSASGSSRPLSSSTNNRDRELDAGGSSLYRSSSLGGGGGAGGGGGHPRDRDRDRPSGGGLAHPRSSSYNASSYSSGTSGRSSSPVGPNSISNTGVGGGSSSTSGGPPPPGYMKHHHHHRSSKLNWNDPPSRDIRSDRHGHGGPGGGGVGGSSEVSGRRASFERSNSGGDRGGGSSSIRSISSGPSAGMAGPLKSLRRSTTTDIHGPSTSSGTNINTSNTVSDRDRGFAIRSRSVGSNNTGPSPIPSSCSAGPKSGTLSGGVNDTGRGSVAMSRRGGPPGSGFDRDREWDGPSRDRDRERDRSTPLMRGPLRASRSDPPGYQSVERTVSGSGQSSFSNRRDSSKDIQAAGGGGERPGGGGPSPRVTSTSSDISYRGERERGIPLDTRDRDRDRDPRDREILSSSSSAHVLTSSAGSVRGYGDAAPPIVHSSIRDRGVVIEGGGIGVGGGPLSRRDRDRDIVLSGRDRDRDRDNRRDSFGSRGRGGDGGIGGGGVGGGTSASLLRRSSSFKQPSFIPPSNKSEKGDSIIIGSSSGGVGVGGGGGPSNNNNNTRDLSGRFFPRDSRDRPNTPTSSSFVRMERHHSHHNIDFKPRTVLSSSSAISSGSKGQPPVGAGNNSNTATATTTSSNIHNNNNNNGPYNSRTNIMAEPMEVVSSDYVRVKPNQNATKEHEPSSLIERDNDVNISSSRPTSTATTGEKKEKPSASGGEIATATKAQTQPSSLLSDSPLTCAALGAADKIKKAEKAVHDLAKFIPGYTATVVAKDSDSKDNATTTYNTTATNTAVESTASCLHDEQTMKQLGSSRLPTNKEIAEGISDIDQQLNKKKKHMTQLKTDIEHALQEEARKILEEEKARKAMEEQKRFEEAKKQHEQQQKVHDEKMKELQERQKIQVSTLSNMKEEYRSTWSSEKSSVESTKKESDTVEKLKAKEESFTEASKNLGSLTNLLDAAAVASAEANRQVTLVEESKVSTNESLMTPIDETKKKKTKGKRNTTLSFDFYTRFDDPTNMTSLIDEITKENHRRAKQSHGHALFPLSNFPPPPLSSFNPNDDIIVSPLNDKHEDNDDETEEDDDEEEFKPVSNMDWALLSRRVQGPTTALYNDPMDNPYWDYNERTHEMNKSRITAELSRRKKLLYDHWTNLAIEYLAHQEKFRPDCITTKNEINVDVVEGEDGSNSNNNSNTSTTMRQSTRTTRNAKLRRAGANSGLILTSNSSSTTGGVSGVCGPPTTDYEKELILKDMAEREALERRIKYGGTAIPRQIGELERNLFVQFEVNFDARRVKDPWAVENDRAHRNPWTDMEKCIFLDRFLQYPKDFRKIASFLRDKSTCDCVEFYYNSKKTMPYKMALKEHIQRKKKKTEASWTATVQCAIAAGAKVIRASPQDAISSSCSGERPVLFMIPDRDDTFQTYDIHPIRKETLNLNRLTIEHAVKSKKKAKANHIRGYNGISLTIDDPKFRGILRPASVAKERDMSSSSHATITESNKAKDVSFSSQKTNNKQKASSDTTKAVTQDVSSLPPTKRAKLTHNHETRSCAPESTPSVEDDSAAAAAEQVVSKSSSSDVVTTSVTSDANHSASLQPPITSSSTATVVKTTPNWTKEEKKIFYETLNLHGRNWPDLESAIQTKSLEQIKSFYVDYKKKLSKQTALEEQKRQQQEKKQEVEEKEKLNVKKSNYEPKTKEGGDVVMTSTTTTTSTTTDVADRSSLAWGRSSSAGPPYHHQLQHQQQQQQQQSSIDAVSEERTRNVPVIASAGGGGGEGGKFRPTSSMSDSAEAYMIRTGMLARPHSTDMTDMQHQYMSSGGTSNTSGLGGTTGGLPKSYHELLLAQNRAAAAAAAASGHTGMSNPGVVGGGNGVPNLSSASSSSNQQQRPTSQQHQQQQKMMPNLSNMNPWMTAHLLQQQQQQHAAQQQQHHQSHHPTTTRHRYSDPWTLEASLRQQQQQHQLHGQQMHHHHHHPHHHHQQQQQQQQFQQHLAYTLGMQQQQQHQQQQRQGGMSSSHPHTMGGGRSHTPTTSHQQNSMSSPSSSSYPHSSNTTTTTTNEAHAALAALQMSAAARNFAAAQQHNMANRGNSPNNNSRSSNSRGHQS